MGYINGKDVLPDKLLGEIQKYVQGELIYIPKNNRAKWGELNGTREAFQRRNRKIYKQFKNGISLEKLMNKYNLSEESIRKIVYG